VAKLGATRNTAEQILKFPVYTTAVQKVSKLVLFLRYARAPRGVTFRGRVLACLGLFELGILAVAFLILMSPQTKIGSILSSSHSELPRKRNKKYAKILSKHTKKLALKYNDIIKMAFGEDFMSRIQVFE
jgi:hypothetical protein